MTNCWTCKDVLVKGENWRPNNGSLNWKYCTKCVRSRAKHVSYGRKIGMKQALKKVDSKLPSLTEQQRTIVGAWLEEVSA